MCFYGVSRGLNIPLLFTVLFHVSHSLQTHSHRVSQNKPHHLIPKIPPTHMRCRFFLTRHCRLRELLSLVIVRTRNDRQVSWYRCCSVTLSLSLSSCEAPFSNSLSLPFKFSLSLSGRLSPTTRTSAVCPLGFTKWNISGEDSAEIPKVTLVFLSFPSSLLFFIFFFGLVNCVFVVSDFGWLVAEKKQRGFLLISKSKGYKGKVKKVFEFHVFIVFEFHVFISFCFIFKVIGSS